MPFRAFRCSKRPRATVPRRQPSPRARPPRVPRRRSRSATCRPLPRGLPRRRRARAEWSGPRLSRLRRRPPRRFRPPRPRRLRLPPRLPSFRPTGPFLLEHLLLRLLRHPRLSPRLRRARLLPFPRRPPALALAVPLGLLGALALLLLGRFLRTAPFRTGTPAPRRLVRRPAAALRRHRLPRPLRRRRSLRFRLGLAW